MNILKFKHANRKDISPKRIFFIAELIGVFLFFTVLFFSGYSLLCKQYGANDFDAQNFVSWDYSGHRGAVLYKDLLFYYGPLFYYKSIMPLAAIAYGILTPITLTGFYLLFKKLFIRRSFAVASLLALALYIPLFIGDGAWNRYGTGALVVGILAYAFSMKRIKVNTTHLFLGALVGVVFSLIHDQGAYISFVYFFLLFITPPLHEGIRIIFTIKYVRLLLVRTFFYISGFFLGFLPFALYLVRNHALNDFFRALNEISYAGIFAKAAFLPYALSKENVLIFVTIFLSVLVGMLIVLFGKVKKVVLIFNVQAALTLYILILQQKNILRSMSQQLAVFCFILLMILYCYVKILFEQQTYKKSYLLYFYVLLLLSFYFFVQPFSPNTLLLQVRERFRSGFINELQIFNKPNQMLQCLTSSFEVQNLPLTQDYKSVYNFLQQEPDFRGQTFSFPADPIFYVMFHQMVPPYSTMYEASHLSAQKKNIEYIEKNSVQYVIYNTIGTDVDGVPMVFRANAMFRYLFNSFGFYKQIGPFIILKKTEKPDLFLQIKNAEVLPILNTLLTNNLQNIPYTEGQYKYVEFIKNPGVHEIFSGSFEELQHYLKVISLESDSTVLAVSSKLVDQENTILKVTADNNLTTTLTFRSCNDKSPCLLNLSNTPLFFKNRKIIEIESTKPTIVQLKIFKISGNTLLW